MFKRTLEEIKKAGCQVLFVKDENHFIYKHENGEFYWRSGGSSLLLDKNFFPLTDGSYVWIESNINYWHYSSKNVDTYHYIASDKEIGYEFVKYQNGWQREPKYEVKKDLIAIAEYGKPLIGLYNLLTHKIEGSIQYTSVHVEDWGGRPQIIKHMESGGVDNYYL